MGNHFDHSPITLAERILNLLDEGSFTATYKYAVILGLIDLCMERTEKGLRAPEMVTTRQLAEKVLDLYWPHTMPFSVSRSMRVLHQNTKGQAQILSDIQRCRKALSDPSISLATARYVAPAKIDRLVKAIERTLIKMPLPRVQVIGGQEDRFIYDIAWRKGDVDRMQKEVTRYQKDAGGSFDNRIHFRPGVAEGLVLLNSLLRPILYRHWARMVAAINGLEESRLEEFLFGMSRKALIAVRPGLQAVQDNRCFYCGSKIGKKAEVDHFIPWSRYPNNGIYNLVLADERCNRDKRDFLASDEHVARWCRRNDTGTTSFNDLARIAEKCRIEGDVEKSLGVARSIYYHLPERTMLWMRGKEFSEIDINRVRDLL